ncbi:MAG: ATP-binding protein, partial [Pseudomonadota bacterium]
MKNRPSNVILPLMVFLCLSGFTIILWRHYEAHLEEMRHKHIETTSEQGRLRPEDFGAKDGMSAYPAPHKTIHLMFLLFGLALSTGLSFLLYSLMQKMRMYQAARDRALHEINERKKTEQEREALLKELSDKNRELESFIYTVSHDLRTPIVTIEGFIGALREDFGEPLGQEGARYLGRISEATQKMEGLINDLLDLSRIGRISEKKREISFADLARDAANALHAQIKERGVIVEIPENMPSLYGEKKRLGQVVDNLIANAVKYIGEDNPSPRIEVGAEKLGDDTVCFVRDNGIGIDEMYFDKIFSIFQRLPAAQKIAGTGIGLTIVKRIVELHGGHVWVESEIGKGSTFYFTIRNRED